MKIVHSVCLSLLLKIVHSVCLSLLFTGNDNEMKAERTNME